MKTTNRDRILEINSLQTLRTLRAEDLAPEVEPIDQSVVEHIFRLCDALWIHDGNPEHPHAELTSGMCSTGFIDTLRVLRFTNLCRILGRELVKKLRQHYNGSVSWAIGSDHAGAAISQSVGTWLGAQSDFTEKGPDKNQLWRRFVIEPHELVLQVEELVTTTGTLDAVRSGLRMGNPHPITFVPVVLSLIHRSSVYEIESAPICHLAHFDIETYKPTECPLCQAGSERIKPKQNWGRLTETN